MNNTPYLSIISYLHGLSMLDFIYRRHFIKANISFAPLGHAEYGLVLILPADDLPPVCGFA
jgi:hypothetical protein